MYRRSRCVEKFDYDLSQCWYVFETLTSSKYTNIVFFFSSHKFNRSASRFLPFLEPLSNNSKACARQLQATTTHLSCVAAAATRKPETASHTPRWWVWSRIWKTKTGNGHEFTICELEFYTEREKDVDSSILKPHFFVVNDPEVRLDAKNFQSYRNKTILRYYIGIGM